VRGYLPNTYVSSFVGFWPVDCPRLVLVVVLDEPRELYWAAHSAAPIFSEIVRRIEGLPDLNRSPYQRPRQKGDDQLYVFSSYNPSNGQNEINDNYRRGRGSKHLVPKLVGLSLRDALRELAFRNIEARVEGSGIVCQQYPQPGKRIDTGLICHLVCQEVMLEKTE